MITGIFLSKALIPVILSGGSGTRLWPLSRADKPKQFLSFGGGETLIAATLRRCSGQGFDPRPIIVAAESHRFMVRETVNALGMEADIVLEPMRRDSCAAIVAGALQAQQRDKDALILVVAADHHIPDAEAFAAAALAARDAAEAGWLVTFGIKPTAPATGYGYILPGKDAAGSTAKRIARFVEKPDRPTAETYLAQGFVWNSGNFLFKASTFLQQAKQLVPNIEEAISASLSKARVDMGFLRLDEKAFAASPQISVDFAIMEKTDKAAVIVVDYGWNDIGSWDAVSDHIAKDAMKNSIVGYGRIAGARNVTVHSESMRTVVIGCENLVVVATPDAVLVVERGQSEKVKDLVKDWFDVSPLPNSGDKPVVPPHHLTQLIVGRGETLVLSPDAMHRRTFVVMTGRAEVRRDDGDRIVFRAEPGQSFELPANTHASVDDVSGQGLALLEIRFAITAS